jgi:hypothetical protein
VTKDEIIRMAREADLWGEIYAMQRFANLVAAVEREACAKLCDEIPALNPMFLLDVAYEAATLDCADAIRARGNNDV